MNREKGDSYYRRLLMQNIMALNATLVSDMRFIAKKNSLTFEQLQIMYSLHLKAKINQSDICKITKLRKYTVSRHIKLLELNGFIVRKPCKIDKKQVSVYLTHSGEIVAENLIDHHNETLDDRFSHLDRKDVVNIVAHLSKITDIYTPITFAAKT